MSVSSLVLLRYPLAVLGLAPLHMGFRISLSIAAEWLSGSLGACLLSVPPHSLERYECGLRGKSGDRCAWCRDRWGSTVAT